MCLVLFFGLSSVGSAIEISASGVITFATDRRFYNNKPARVAEVLDSEDVTDKGKARLIERIARDANMPDNLRSVLFAPNRKYSKKLREIVLIHLVLYAAEDLGRPGDSVEWTEAGISVLDSKAKEGEDSQRSEARFNSLSRMLDMASSIEESTRTRGAWNRLASFCISRVGFSSFSEVDPQLKDILRREIINNASSGLKSASLDSYMVNREISGDIELLEDLHLYSEGDFRIAVKNDYENFLQKAYSGQLSVPEVWVKFQTQIQKKLLPFMNRQKVSIDVGVNAPPTEADAYKLLLEGKYQDAFGILRNLQEPISIVTVGLLAKAAGVSEPNKQQVSEILLDKLPDSVDKIIHILSNHPDVLAKLGVCAEMLGKL